MKKLLLITLSVVSLTTAFAQQPACGFDLFRQLSPDAVQQQKALNLFLYQKTMDASARPRSSRSVVYIPIVVHIIHQNGPENISDAAVIAGINQMNLRYQNAAPYYDSTGHAMDIQFCLASVDPQGNPTTGITRNYSSYSYLNASDDVLMKNVNRWDPTNYYNVWVVHSIYGFNISVSGYAYMPSFAGTAYDGVVIDYYSISGSVLSHESGHYLGLNHTWEGGCTNFNCLLDGDAVCDTPPDTSTTVCRGNSCSSEMNDTSGFNPFTADMNDLPNYMDYTPCPLSFTQGQADRMNNVISFIRYQLLQSPACGFTGGPAPTANLGYIISPCHDGVVHFIDTLSANYATVNWDFNNDGVWDSYSHNPDYTFPATGTYTVKLTVVGTGGVNTVYQTLFVQKGSTPFYPVIFNGGVFTNSHNQWASCGNFTNNFTAPAHAQSYLWSTGDTTQNISFTPNSTYTLTLTIVDSMGLTWSNQLCRPLTVIVNPLPPTAAIYTNQPLSNCVGDVVTFHAGLPADPGYTLNWYQNSQILGSHDTILSIAGNNQNMTYQLIISDTNYCYSWSNILYVNWYAPPITQSLTQNGFVLSTGWGGGNQWYFNGAPITGATGMSYTATQNGCYQDEWYFGFAPNCTTMSDSICINTVGVNALTQTAGNFEVYPVPASEVITIVLPGVSAAASYSVTDPLGRELLTGILTEPATQINVSGLTSGVYFIHVSGHGIRKITLVD